MREAVVVQRRITILVALVLLLLAIVAFVVPRPERADDPTPRTLAGPTSGTDVTAAVHGTLPRDKVVRAKVGDLVALTVTSTEPNSASIEAFGLTEATDRGAPAQFSFLADRAGSFPVTLLLGETAATVGRLVVK